MEYPKRIDNGAGEVLVFERLEQTPEGDCVEVSNEVQPGAGPPMHVHFKQEEALTVVEGRLGYQVQGEEPQFAGPGETVLFKEGVAHKFWAEGDQVLRCTGYVKPANNVVYFLSEIYESTRNNGGEKPDDFDAAFLLHKYRTEFDIYDVPGFVKSVVFPALRAIGGASGKFAKYEDGPAPLI
jgi:quercetin dioxygenase-like cupin family protein